MMRVLGLAIAILLFPVGAFAQSSDKETGSRVRDRLEDQKKLAARDAIKAAQRWGECVYFVRNRTVQRYLTTTDPDDWEAAATLVYKKVDCDIYIKSQTEAEAYNIQTSLSDDRGLLAEAALKAEKLLRPDAEIAPALPLADGYNRAWFSMNGRSSTINIMSICFAETQPELVVELLRTERSTSEENVAIGNVASELGPCLAEGATLQANAFQLRNALAEAYYQRLFGQNEQIMVSEPAGKNMSAEESN